MNKGWWTQQQLADAICVSQPTVQRWLKGTVPDGNHLAAMADFFGVSMDALWGRAPLNLPETTAEKPSATEVASKHLIHNAHARRKAGTV